MWRNSAIGTLMFCIIAVWATSIIVLHFFVHHRIRDYFSKYILIIIPVICFFTWIYYNVLLGKIVTAVVLTEKHIITMGKGLWFLVSNTYRNGLYFIVSIPIDRTINIVHTQLNLKDGSGKLWVSASNAPFGMQGPDVMVRAEIIFRKQFESMTMLRPQTPPEPIPAPPAYNAPFPVSPIAPPRGFTTLDINAEVDETNPQYQVS